MIKLNVFINREVKVKKLHLLEDSVYADWFISNCLQCNISNLENHFVCITDELVNAKHPLIKVISENSEEYNDILLKVNQNYYTTVYVNFLNYSKAVFTNKITSKNPTLVWIVWGGDLYSLKVFNFKMYDAYSQNFLNERTKLSLRQYLGRLKLKYINKVAFETKKNDKEEDIYKAIRKIKVCATFMSQEVKYIEDTLKLKVGNIPFAVISVKNEVNVQNSVHKHRILIGNSADPSNNHFEVLKTLQKHKIKDEIVIPLSYGDMTYSNKLKKDIANFKLQINTIDTILPKEDYYNLLSTVKVAVFGHNIQQGFGNILALIYFGAKIFLKKENPLFIQFKKWDIIVFSIENDLTKIELDKELSIDIYEKNKENILKLFSSDKVNEYYNKLLQL